MKPLSLTFMSIVSLLIIPMVAIAADNLQGEAFTDPDYTLEMEEGWQERPIIHDADIGQADLVVTLDQHLYQALAGIIQEYAEAHGLKIAVSDGTCGITAGKLVRKSVDIGGYCCPPGLTDRLPGLRFHTVGIVPLQILVHPDNPVDNLSLQQVRDIFQGLIYRWSEVKDSQGRPGRDTLIQTIGRLHCKIRPGHWRLLLDNEDLFGPRLQEVGTIPDMISLVGESPDAIGYEVGMMVERYRNQGRVKALRIDGQEPSPANLLSGRYPLYRTLNLTTWEGGNDANLQANELVEYLLGLDDQLGKEYGLVPASALRKAGWQFKGDELIGAPQ